MNRLRLLGVRLLRKLKVQLRRVGATEYCPLCDGAYRFLPWGLIRRERARCPGCDSLERHRFMWLWLKASGVLDRPVRILHFAPELCISKRLATCPGVEYVSADSMASDYATPGLYKMDITDIGFPDESFDVVIASHVLEHVPDDRRAIRELRRVVRPGGVGLILVPFDDDRDETFEDWSITSEEGRLRAFGQADHVRVYALSDYKKRLCEAGWDVTEDEWLRSLSSDERKRFGLPAPGTAPLWNSTMIICRPREGTT